MSKAFADFSGISIEFVLYNPNDFAGLDARIERPFPLLRTLMYFRPDEAGNLQQVDTYYSNSSDFEQNATVKLVDTDEMASLTTEGFIRSKSTKVVVSTTIRAIPKNPISD